MKTKFKVFRLNFGDHPIHISDARADYGSGEKTIHSDTLHAALIACLAKTGNVIPAGGDLGCVLSSLFPFYKETYFLPRPFLNFNTGKEDLSEWSKKIKKVKWLDAKYFSLILRNEIFNFKPLENKKSWEFFSDVELPEKFIDFQIVPRVAVPRSAEDNKGDTNIFYFERMTFSKDAGLYFIANGETTLLEKALTILQHEGLGSDRNVGYGSFTFEKKEMELELPDEAEYAMNLSLYCPSDKGEWEKLGNYANGGENIRYEIIKRGGWLTGDEDLGKRKKHIYMLLEGGIFKTQNEVLGSIHNLQSGSTLHPVYRSGKALFLKCKLN